MGFTFIGLQIAISAAAICYFIGGKLTQLIEEKKKETAAIKDLTKVIQEKDFNVQVTIDDKKQTKSKLGLK